MKFKKLSLAVGAMTLLPMSVVVSCNKKTDEKKTIEELSKKITNAENELKTQSAKHNKDLDSIKKENEETISSLNSKYEKLAKNIGKTKPALITSEESMKTINSLIEFVKAEKSSNPTITKNELIVKISDKLMDKPYVGERLIGSAEVQEQLVADIEQLDCYTLLDYVNALLDATSFDTFLTNLKATRYNESKVEYINRKHYFTDWEHGTAPIAKNLVAEKENDPAFADKVVTVNFVKNKKPTKEGGFVEHIEGIGFQDRTVKYLKVDAVTDEFMKANFKDGDLIMLAAPEFLNLNTWLDVTHCGYLVFKDGKAMYRNASSRKSLMKVADINLVEYLTDRNFNSKEGKPYETPRVPGILVYRTL